MSRSFDLHLKETCTAKRKFELAQLKPTLETMELNYDANQVPVALPGVSLELWQTTVRNYQKLLRQERELLINFHHEVNLDCGWWCLCSSCTDICGCGLCGVPWPCSMSHRYREWAKKGNAWKKKRNKIYESLLGVLRQQYRSYNTDVKLWNRNWSVRRRRRYDEYNFVDGFTFTSFPKNTTTSTAVPVVVATATASAVIVKDTMTTPTAPTVKNMEMER